MSGEAEARLWLGRAGRVHVEQDAAGQVWVGGAVRTLFAGHAL